MKQIARSLAALACAAAFVAPAAQAQTTLKMQATWPASLTLYENFTYFADRVQKISGGSLKIETMPAGQVVPAFEVLDATHKKVLDGAHAWAGYWTGKNKASILFTGGPGGTFGMDFIDVMGWMYHGGGLELYDDFYQKELKLNLHVLPILPSGPQAFGWFKRPIKNLADFKGMKCRETGMAAEVFQRMGMQTVNMPGGEIIPSAQRGVIDCAEWVGGVEDLRLGFHNVWKYHYTPGMHENTTIGELVINGDVWKGLSQTHKEIIQSASNEAFLIWWAKWQKQNAEAMKEMQEKHGVRILRTPPDILIEFLKTWDVIAKEESAKSPFFKKTLESQRTYAALVVPAKRFMFPPYSFAANYYFPEGGAKPAAPAKKK
ncbi:MAG TPA: TRAP transporter substrate-binding protein [Burkholderiales bacterium]|jgi:TRAP-type mannitol/chloroaromatic compound transport system substrate-binding protein|nr:TRAP transporter substrate-binding protein [Burkholderiales bacterium]